MDSKNFVSIREASRRSGIPEKRLYKMRDLGQLPGVRMSTRYFVDWAGLEKMLTPMQAEITQKNKEN